MVLTGLDRLLARTEILRKRRIGLIANQTSVGRELAYGWDLLAESGVDIGIIFSPEHGLFGTEQDQKPVTSSQDVPYRVSSLYGNSSDSLAPIEEDLGGIDAVLFDIQDIGCRYYTYVNTMVLFMRALHGRGIEFLVLDRPNPLGGLAVEGPGIREGYESFVGVLPVPVRHALTPGELARLALDHFKIDLELTVIEMSGWKRSMYFDATGLTWVPPSPNMPTLATAIVYPGACLFEGTTISEGRGTTTPFELIGASGADPFELAGELESLPLPGVRFRPVRFRPTFNKYQEVTIGGIAIHVTDRELFRPFATGVAICSVLNRMAPGFEFTQGVYEFNSAHPAFDLLTGSASIRGMIERGEHINRILESWSDDERLLGETIRNYRLYEDE